MGRPNSGSATEAFDRESLDAPFSGSFFNDDFSVPVAFKGVVLNQEDRSPVNGAHVRMLALSSNSETLEKTTGAHGTFTIDAPPAYRYELNVEAEGYSRYRNDSLVITRPDYNLEILLAPSLALKGHVVDLQAQGIPGAMVSLLTDQRGRPSMSTTTDAQGMFVFTSMKKGLRFQLDAYHAGYNSIGKTSATMPVEEEIILRMKPSAATGSLVGTVNDTMSRPIAGAKISLTYPPNTSDLTEVLTDSKGEYRIPRVREGIYITRCTADDFSKADNNNQAIIAISSGKESRLDFNLKTGLQIRGAVLNQKNEPVANAQVTYMLMNLSRGRGMRSDRTNDPRGGQSLSSQGESVSTDEKGMFQIDGLSEGSYQINIQQRDYLDFSTVLQPSTQLQTLTLDSSLSVRGAARNIQGASIERFSLSFQSMTGRYSKSSSFTTSDGYFEIRGLPRDKYTLTLKVSDRENENYSGTLDLQTSMQVFLMTGEKPDVANEFRGGRGGGFGGPSGSGRFGSEPSGAPQGGGFGGGPGGGRGNMPAGGPGNRSRVSESNSLTIVAKAR